MAGTDKIARHLADALGQEHPLYWAGPDLARAGLLSPEPWVAHRATRAAAMIPNQALKPAAAIMAAMHRDALDYISQAPVIVLAGSFGGKVAKRIERTFVAQNFKALCDRQPKLKDVLAAYQLALPWRALAPAALEPSALESVRALNKVLSASELAQVLAIRRDGHRTWLREVSAFHAMIRRRGAGGASVPTWLRWAATAMARHDAEDRPLRDTGAPIADWLIANPTAFNPRWTWARAEREMLRWHEMLRSAELDARHDPALLDAEIDYAPLPNEPWHDKQFSIVPLRSIRALHLDGAAMHHCVASYAGSVKAGHCRIYSVRQRAEGEDPVRVATLELAPNGMALQLKGPCNRAVAENVRIVAHLFAKECAKAYRLSITGGLS